MKTNLTAKDIMLKVGISNPMFYRLKHSGIIPPADDSTRKPHTWNSDNQQLVDFFKSRNIQDEH